MPGGAPGLQNQSWGSAPVPGGFDSHTLTPAQQPCGLQVDWWQGERIPYFLICFEKKGKKRRISIYSKKLLS